MTKQEKQQLVNELVERLKATPNFYVLNAGGMTVAEVNKFRRKCFESNFQLTTVKNTLIVKALEEIGGDYSELIPALKQPSALVFAEVDRPSDPAKMLKAFRKTTEKPVLKAAYIDQSVFVGDNQIDVLSTLKTKADLIGEVVGLLQSPAKNVVSALQSGGAKLAGIVKTLSEKEG